MSMAWETTDEDVRTVLHARLARWPTDAEVEEALDHLDGEDDRITKAALRGDEIEEQLTFAYLEIGAILDEAAWDETAPDLIIRRDSDRAKILPHGGAN